MTRWHPLAPVDADFFSSAPHVFRYQKKFPATPEQVWKSLTSNESLAAWGPEIKKVTWTSPRPLGMGATRDVVAAGEVITMRERFFRWEEGRRHSFCAYESTLPIFKRFAEDYVVEPDGADTLFTWTVALEPTSALALPFKVLTPALRVASTRIFKGWQRHFAALRQHRP
jgi:Polyketide cyclase / dehydrase and lipid transport